MLDGWTAAIRSEWAAPRRRPGWALVLGALVAALLAWSRFLTWVEARPGVRLPDPLLDRLPAVDLTWPIFSVVYGGLVVGLVALARTPRRLSVGLLSYAVMLALRVACMSLVALDPPPRMILLVDPLVSATAMAGTPTRDLFFSGHTATLCVIAFAAPAPWMRRTYLALAALMGAMVLLQHVHYSVDVLVAPMAAYVSHRIAVALHGEAVG